MVMCLACAKAKACALLTCMDCHASMQISIHVAIRNGSADRRQSVNILAHEYTDMCVCILRRRMPTFSRGMVKRIPCSCSNTSKPCPGPVPHSPEGTWIAGRWS